MLRGLVSWSWAVLLLLGPALALAQGRGTPVASTEQEIARLQDEVRELRQMLIQAMQVEQQHHELLLRLLQSGGGGGPSAGARPALRALPTATTPAAAQASDRPADRGATSAAITGSVTLKGDVTGQPVYVFVEDLRAAPVRGQTLEIIQKNKQFSPQVSVIPWGTSVYFPNNDPVAHNVFSPSRRRTFDLGLLKAGERGNPVVLRTPGLVEVYCDIHEKMWASILVLPNSTSVKVAPDGKFRLPNVPVGERVVGAWTAGAQQTRQKVLLTGAGATVQLTLQVSATGAHNNKSGQPYGSYTE